MNFITTIDSKNFKNLQFFIDIVLLLIKYWNVML